MKVSVLMPVRNEAGRVVTAIESILAQTHENLEIIAIDDGSEDSTFDEMSSVRDPRLVIHKSASSQGLARQLNRCAALASGQLLARQDGDDFSLPRRLELQVREFTQSGGGIAVVGTDFWRVSEDDEVCVLMRIDGASVRSALYSLQNPLAHGSLVFCRAWFDRVGGYNEQLRTAQDLELLIKLISKAAMGHVPRPLYVHRIRRSNATAKRNARDLLSRLIIARAVLRSGANVKTSALLKGMIKYSKALLVGRSVSPESLYQLKVGLLFELAGDLDQARLKYRQAINASRLNLAARRKLHALDSAPRL